MNEQLLKVKIVQIIAILLFSLCTFPLFAQNKVITQIDNNLYEYRAFNQDGSLQQKGMYFKTNDDKLLIHDYWKDEFGNKALYNKGKLVWYQPNGEKRYTYEYIRMEQLSRKVESLEALLASKN